MTLTRLALGNPVAVAVGAILIAIFGIISMTRLPIELTPEISRPQILVLTNWRASAPEEIESEIIEPQENVLRSTPGLVRMTSSANYGSATITLDFVIGTDMNRALIEVMNRLNQVPRYPVDADEPIINTGGRNFERVIAWFAISNDEGNERDIASYQDFIDDNVVTRMERVPGVSWVGSFGGRSHEVRITFDPYKAAGIGLDLTAISSELGTNTDVSAGSTEVGRRQYTVRFSGRYEVESLGELVLEWREGRPIKLNDVARIEMTMVDPTTILHQNGGPAVGLAVAPESGVNVLEVMQGIKQAADELNDGLLDRAGLDLAQNFDQSIYINQSIEMVRTNLMLGIALAIAVLWWFLRRFRATIIVSLSIPLCLFASFLVMDAAGRTVNIISLAGLAFATGMVLDAAIVVLENIFRQREAGRDPFESSERGTAQVWGALLASTATTVAIFMPVVFLEDEAGQLFADLAITISAAVVASLVVAVTVLPTAAAVWIKGTAIEDLHKSWWEWASDHIMSLTDTPRQRWTWVLVLTLSPLILVMVLKPPADYLPEGRQDFVQAFLIAPPGQGVQTGQDEIMDEINRRLRPHINGDHEVQMSSYYMGSDPSFGTFMGGRAADPAKVDDLLFILNTQVLTGFPDTFGFASRESLFAGERGGRLINLDLQAENFESLLGAGQAGFFSVMQALPGASVQPIPGLELAEPELRLVPDDRRIAEVGWNRARMSTVVRAMGDGAFLGEYFDGTRRYNVILRAEPWDTPEQLMAIPVATPSGEVQALSELVNLERTAGPSNIQRVDRRRTLTLQISPPPDMAIEEALAVIEADVLPIVRSQLPIDGTIKMSGTAEALHEALGSMIGSFTLAIVILYLLISALFRSFRDSVLVVMTIPMATVGGIVSLRLIDLMLAGQGGQQMDLLTMIGFVILLGLVVNNAILLVYRARDAEREGMSRKDAVESAVRLRLRPILMSTLTSIFGMLPLMLVPGAGSELYRGMAAVIVGGMLVSTVFTLVLLPSLLRMNEGRSAVVHSRAEAV